ncbi:MAG: DUF2285 domain-containing protein [Polaromonas sp.]
MFERPDWKNPEPYKEFLDPDMKNWTAWEFLRRNPDYQKDADFYHAEMGNSGIDENPERFDEWCRYCENRWQLIRPLMTAGGDFSGGDFVMLLHDWTTRFKIPGPGNRIEGPLVLIPADLSMPLKDLQEQVMQMLHGLRNDGIKRGVVKPRITRVLAPRVYVEQLRILDAFAAGATAQEIGDVLAPGATNDPEARQRDKRIKAAYRAALKMQDGGYRALI